ncbi:MAG: hypothetical protein HYV28_14415 [Ignavibacteriales bacterium]|nr:hypothetical protein [Ignavibacteriales bacterium]
MRLKSIIVSIFLCFGVLFGQAPVPKSNFLTGGFGMTNIDNQQFYSFRFAPEFSFSKFGVGLDLNLEFGNGGLRKENFNETSDYLSIIRYIRYGNKKEPVFVKVGAIDGYSLGHGSIVYMYNNSPSFDSRKIGVVLDVNAGNWGFESIYSDFSMGGVAALRGYVKPLQYTALKAIPIISNLEAGATIAGDFHSKAKIVGFKAASVSGYEYVEGNDASVFGVDLGLPIISTKFFSTELYADYAKFLNFGSGASAGISMGLDGLGLLSANVKFERRWNNAEYISGYYGSLYEIERFSFNPTSKTVNSKLLELKAATNAEKGYFGGLNVDIVHLIKIYGSFQKLEGVEKSGILEMTAEVEPTAVSFVARAGYSKAGINDGADMFKLDDRSYLFAELGYKPYEYLLVSMVYNWTFTPVRDNDDNIISYESQKRIEPRVSFIYPLGGKK